MGLWIRSLARRPLAVAFLLVCTGPRAASSQEVMGRLLDAESGQAVEGAVVSLIDGDAVGAAVASGLTNENGRFRLAAPRRGRYRLKAERIGYAMVSSPAFDLVPGPALEVELTTSTQAIPLAPLTVVSTRPALVLSERLYAGGFYRRQADWGRKGMGFATFREQDEIRSRNPSRMTDIFRGIAGVHVEGNGGFKQRITMRSVTSMFQGHCAPMYYLDGRPLRLMEGDSIDDLRSPWEVVAVEVYPGINKPGEFSAMGAHACGAIAIWTGYAGPSGATGR
jgi:hypothetical protein